MYAIGIYFVAAVKCKCCANIANIIGNIRNISKLGFFGFQALKDIDLDYDEGVKLKIEK